MADVTRKASPSATTGAPRPSLGSHQPPSSMTPQGSGQRMDALQDMYGNMVNQMDRFHHEMNSVFASQGRMLPRLNHRYPFASMMDRDPFFNREFPSPSSMMLSDIPHDPNSFGSLAIPSSSNLFGTFRPKVDIRDEGNQLVVLADLPGMDKEDVKVDVVNGMITIKASHKEDKSRDEANFHMHERCVGNFYRSFPLPEGVKEDGIRAAFSQGVLEVKLPKEVTSKAEMKSIRID